MNRRIACLFLGFLVLISAISFRNYFFKTVYTAAEDSVIVDGRTYVSTGNDCNLEPLQVGRLLEKTKGVEVYEIVGQENRDWVFIKGGIYSNSVFRREDISPVNFRALPISEIQVMDRSGKLRLSTKDPNIINEFIGKLKNPVRLSTPYPDTALYRIRTISPSVKGIACISETGVNGYGRVYLVHRGRDLRGDDYVEAGPNFTNWIRSIR